MRFYLTRKVTTSSHSQIRGFLSIINNSNGIDTRLNFRIPMSSRYQNYEFRRKLAKKINTAIVDALCEQGFSIKRIRTKGNIKSSAYVEVRV